MMLVTMTKEFARYSSLQNLILAANNLDKVCKSYFSLGLMIWGWLNKKKISWQVFVVCLFPLPVQEDD